MPISTADRSRAAGSIIYLALAATLAALAFSLVRPPPPAVAAGPKLEARSWILIDPADGATLAARAPGRSLPIASATKMMTAYVALQRLDLDEQLPAADYDPLPVESVLGLQTGEKLEVRDLITAMMLPSANDAAVTVAEGAAGSRERFVNRMNRAARRLGMEDSSFANPIGLDDPNNFSSARDLATLAVELRRNRFFRRTVAQTSARLDSGASVRQVETRNSLARSDPRVDGIKTGHTNGAGYVLVASAERKGVRLISAVLDAPSESARDAETKRLLDYGFSLYRTRTPIERREVVAALAVDGEEQPLRVISRGGVKVQLRDGERADTELELPDRIDRAVEQGERLGTARVRVGETVVGEVPLLATRAVAEPGGLAEDAGNLLAIALIGGGAMVLLAGTGLALRRRGGGSGREAKVRETERNQAERESSRLRRERRRTGDNHEERTS
ncbi:MAG: D-alanyl-D-alanine carboxypeptidase family protein [Solirubrobacterales bacterium]